MAKQFQVMILRIRRVAISAPLQWLKQAWHIFKQDPISWIPMGIAVASLSIISSFHPILMIAAFLINPFLTAGIYKSVMAIQQNQKISFFWLFKPLQEPECRSVLLRLAAVNMFLSLPASFLINSLAIQYQQDSVVNVFTLLLFVALYSVTWMLLAYSTAIAYCLKEQRILVILQASLIACWRNIPALIFFGVLGLAMIVLAMLAMFVGLLLVVPIINIAFFLSFNDFFGAEKTDDDEAMFEV